MVEWSNASVRLFILQMLWVQIHLSLSFGELWAYLIAVVRAEENGEL